MTTDTAVEKGSEDAFSQEGNKQDRIKQLGELRGEYKKLRPFVRRATFGLEGKPDIRTARKAGFIAAKSLLEEMQGKYDIDPLTSLLTKSAFQKVLEVASEKSKDSGEQLRVLFMDLNGFKAVNDQLGHDVGDEALKRFGQIVADNIRPYDTASREGESSETAEDEQPITAPDNIASRFGGDEFQILLKKSDNRGVRSVFKRLRLALKNDPFFQGLVEKGINVTISAGAATVDQNDPLRSLKEADSAMYQAKSINHENDYVGNQLIIADSQV
ncbi:MAG: GGDEF domain-containing protein [Patescibacteria group bacterium]